MGTYSYTQSVEYHYNNGDIYQGQDQTVECSYHSTEYRSPLIKVRRDSDGWRAMTPYSRLSTKEWFPVYGSNVLEKVYDDSPSGYKVLTYNTNAPPLRISITYPPESGSFNNRKLRAFSKVKSQSVNIAMMMLGAVSTAQTILKRITELLSFLRKVRKGDLVGALRSIKRAWRPKTEKVVDNARKFGRHRRDRYSGNRGKIVTDLWLEVNFVHMQLYSDVKGLMDFISKTRFPFIHGRSADITNSDISYDSGDLYSWNYIGRFKGVIHVKRVDYIQLSYMINTSFLHDASSLGLTNIPYLIWDSIPLSFVIDWIIPVGNFFNSFDSTLGLTFKGGMSGLKLESDGVLQSSAVTGWTGGAGLTCSVRTVSFDRSLIDDSIVLPDFRNPLSGVAWKIATAASLVVAIFGSPQRRVTL